MRIQIRGRLQPGINKYEEEITILGNDVIKQSGANFGPVEYTARVKRHVLSG